MSLTQPSLTLTMIQTALCEFRDNPNDCRWREKFEEVVAHRFLRFQLTGQKVFLYTKRCPVYAFEDRMFVELFHPSKEEDHGCHFVAAIRPKWTSLEPTTVPSPIMCTLSCGSEGIAARRQRREEADFVVNLHSFEMLPGEQSWVYMGQPMFTYPFRGYGGRSRSMWMRTFFPSEVNSLFSEVDVICGYISTYELESVLETYAIAPIHFEHLTKLSTITHTPQICENY